MAARLPTPSTELKKVATCSFATHGIEYPPQIKYREEGARNHHVPVLAHEKEQHFKATVFGMKSGDKFAL